MGSIISATFWRMNVPQRVPSWMQLNIWLSATLLFFQRQQTTVWRYYLWNGVDVVKYAVIPSYCGRLGRFGFYFGDPVDSHCICPLYLAITELIKGNVVKQIVNKLRCIIRPQLTPSLPRDYNGLWMLGLPQRDVGELLALNISLASKRRFFVWLKSISRYSCI